MNNWSSDFIEVNGIKIHYTRTGGKKPPFVLLHGYSDNGLCWTRTARELESDFDVIMPDLRNHGLSTDVEEGIETFEMMKEIVELIDKLKLDRTWILGHSMGGRIASLIAENYPDIVKGVILVDPGLNFKPKISFREMMIYFAFKVMLNNMRKKTEEQMLQTSRRVNHSWDAIDHKVWAKGQYQFAQLKYKASFELLRRERVLWQETLPSITVPVLLMVAEKGVIPKKYFQLTEECLNDGEWMFFEKTGHNIHRDQFRKFMKSVKDFIQR